MNTNTDPKTTARWIASAMSVALCTTSLCSVAHAEDAASAARANGASPAKPTTGGSWGWIVVASSVGAGALLTFYGLTFDCTETDRDCQRRASLPIWGGVAVASAGSLVGLGIVQAGEPDAPKGAVLRLSGRF